MDYHHSVLTCTQKWAVLGGVGVTMYVTFYIDAHLFFPKWYSQSTE